MWDQISSDRYERIDGEAEIVRRSGGEWALYMYFDDAWLLIHESHSLEDCMNYPPTAPLTPESKMSTPFVPTHRLLEDYQDRDSLRAGTLLRQSDTCETEFYDESDWGDGCRWGPWVIYGAKMERLTPAPRTSES